MSHVFTLDGAGALRVLRACIPLSRKIRIAVAWAKWDHPIEQALRLNAGCVNTFLVGTSFGQTDATLLQHWQGHGAFWIWPNFKRGVFHPKVYLLRGRTWSLAVVGSSNLTHGGLAPAGQGHVEQSMAFLEGTPEHGMSEVQKHIRSNGQQAMTTKESTMNPDFMTQIEAHMDQMLEPARRVEVDWLKRYETLLKHQNHRPDRMQRSLVALDAPAHPLAPNGAPQGDEGAEDSVSVVDRAMLACHLRSPTEWDQRLAILKQAQVWWTQYTHFSRMPVHVRQALAGTIKRMRDTPADGVDWHLFGHMREGRGPFRALLQQKDSEKLHLLSHALDAIPMQGAVTASHYQQFSERYRPLHGAVANPGISTVTRLLALKRPDVFMPITAANLSGMARCLGLRAQKPRLEDYGHTMAQLKNQFQIKPTDLIDLTTEEGIAGFSPMALLDAVLCEK